MSFLTKGWPYIIFGALTILCLIQHLQIKSLKIQRDAARQQLNLANRTIEKQNASVLEYKRIEAVQAKRLADSDRAAAQIQRNTDKQYEEVQNEHVPSECADAIDWAIKKGQDLRD